ncbi:MAG TPA: alpha/beta hydrolase-fold protein [Rhodothermales bacterium]
MRRISMLAPAMAALVLIAGCDSGGSKDDEEKRYDVAFATYQASVLGGVDRRMMVAVPADYEELDEPLPVLYLLHGWGGSETDWTNQGRAVETLSALYEAGDVVPMIVVMPNNVHPAANPLAGGPDRDLFLRELQTDIIPYVQVRYRASTDRSDRAIAGLSAGGIQTLNLTLFYPELWSYSFPMSTAYFPEDQARLDTDFADDLDVAGVNSLEEFELAIAPDDALFYTLYQTLQDVFDEKGIQYTTWEGPGAHTWAFWSTYFEVMAPKLFR